MWLLISAPRDEHDGLAWCFQIASLLEEAALSVRQPIFLPKDRGHRCPGKTGAASLGWQLSCDGD